MDVFTDILAEPWFWPAISVIVGLPVVLLVLGEVHTAMVRRSTPGAHIVLLIRNVLAPLGAVLVLFTQIPQAENAEFTWAKVAATAFGFVVILVLLNGLNLAIFVTAKQGTWRNRLPSIFVDIARVVLIVTTLAILFGWIWGADIGGFFTALGIGSIIIGLALQNAVGPVVSGLFLLFEQPFEIGDFIATDAGTGRVVAVNWRATHLDVGNGILIIPNSTLSGASFRNLSRLSASYTATDTVRFASDDPPQEVLDLLVEVASGLPQLIPDAAPSAVAMGRSRYTVAIPVANLVQEAEALSVFRLRIWYAARRAGLHLDRDLTDTFATPERTRENLIRLAPRLHLSREEALGLLDGGARLERYGEGEVVQRFGRVPDGVRVIVSGVAELSVPGSRGAQIPVVQLKRDDILGLTALTRQAAGANVIAVVDLAVLAIPAAALDSLVTSRPALARDIGATIDARQELGERALAEAGEKPSPTALVIA